MNHKFLEDIKQDFTIEFFNSREHNKHHTPHDQEVREFTCVRNGDLHQLQITLKEKHRGQSVYLLLYYCR